MLRAAVGGADVSFTGWRAETATGVEDIRRGLYNFIRASGGIRSSDFGRDSSGRCSAGSQDMARQTDVPRIKLELAGVTQSVDVSAEVAGVVVATARSAIR
jgi:hypothetical protein